MTQDIKNLIDKIQQEGIQAAQDKAKEIESKAQAKAKEIVDKAKVQADSLMAEAKERVAKLEESSKASLKQAGRDLLISLKKEINNLLTKLIASHIRHSLNPDELAKIIIALIKNYHDKGQIVISLKKEDLDKLERGFLSELKDEVKKGITLRPSEDIQAGFSISYDAGKSHFDFTDKVLAEYIGSYIKPKLNEILNY